MNAGMTVHSRLFNEDARLDINTFAGAAVVLSVFRKGDAFSVDLSSSEARELAGALRRAADELDPIPEGKQVA